MDWMEQSHRLHEMEHEKLTQQIIGCAMQVHFTLGPGFLESVYEKALSHELNKAGLRTECQKPIEVTYDGIVVGDFSADIFVEGAVIVENKAVQVLHPLNEVQLVNYLTATRVDVGLLLNFGSQRLQFKRKHRTYRSHPESIQ
jgi:GxxExxY protein